MPAWAASRRLVEVAGGGGRKGEDEGCEQHPESRQPRDGARIHRSARDQREAQRQIHWVQLITSARNRRSASSGLAGRERDQQLRSGAESLDLPYAPGDFARAAMQGARRTGPALPRVLKPAATFVGLNGRSPSKGDAPAQVAAVR